MNIICENIRLYRKQLGLTQTELAEKLYVTSQTISKWEKGISLPTLDNIIALSEIFSTSIDNLVKSHSAKISSGYIAIDGGGTKTEFLLFTETGDIKKRLVLEGTNPNVVGMKKALSTLKIGIDMLKSSHFEIVGIFLGIAGCAAKSNNQELSALLKAEYPRDKFLIESDITNVVHSARGIKKCVASICGTGIATFAYDGKNLTKFGGWGYLFDYSGSGFDIGRDAIRYALEYETGLKPYSILYDKVKKKHGEKIDTSVADIYKKGNDYIASFAPLVFEAYREGDTVSEKIIRKSTDHLAELINLASEKCDCGNTCIISGGLTKAKDILEKFLKENIKKDIIIIFPEFPQVYGAALKCMSLFGPTEYDEDLFDKNFKEKYPERMI
ncbi:MAG: XRE family transcriptional regulator [Ruminococcaceae bacterium]|nr:XRE family transcriptional regulator [Oscillospiraceae bacterium]